MKNMKKIILSVLILMSLILSSCSVSIGDEAAFFDEVGKLIEQSYTVNNIYFGDGLPFDDDEGKTAEEIVAESNDTIGVKVIYRNVSENARFNSRSAIEELTKSVYSEEYASFLEKTGFEGVVDDNDNVISYARYIEDAEGKLTINIKSVADAMDIVRTYDLDSITIKRKGRDYVVVTVDAYDDGVYAEKKDLRVNLESDGWRLDWPTY